MTVHKPSTLALVVTLTLTGVGCAAAPRVRPVKGADVDTGTGSLEYDRRQLQGTWRLSSYTVYEGPAGRPVPATAQLTYDEFGNLSITGSIKDTEGAGAAQRLLMNVTGRAVLDVHKKELRLVALDGAEAIPIDSARRVDFNETRRYAITPGSLTLTVVGDTGNTLATSVWTKLQ
jgi:hypothetical protein